MRKPETTLQGAIKTLLFLGLLAVPAPLTAAAQPPGIFVDEVQVVFMESFPLQAAALVKGNLSDPCTEIDEVKQEKDGNTFVVTITTRRGAEGCIAVLEPFVKNIPLSIYGLKAGEYRVEVNGVTATFTLRSDNVLNMGR